MNPQSPSGQQPQRAPFAIRAVIAGWVIAEFLAFFVLVVSIGPGWSVLALLGTSVIGAVVLGSLGRRSMEAMREEFRAAQKAEGRQAPVHMGPLPNGSAVAGALLLLLPGFVTDLVGLALILPPTRGLFKPLVKRFTPKQPTPSAGTENDDVIDGEVISEHDGSTAPKDPEERHVIEGDIEPPDDDSGPRR
ncbi:FxsA family protein [Haloglycomyces albus]|uniref:FxsA family protein n=1 Tax=Haloglycomyces albus TaxID=526067 RepID=UPI00046CE4A7|nr:FxsA family protein [Haloglycomyces albus]